MSRKKSKMISRLFPWASEFMSFPYKRENIGNEAVFFGIYGEFSFTHRVRYTNMTSKEKYLVHSWRYEYMDGVGEINLVLVIRKLILM